MDIVEYRCYEDDSVTLFLVKDKRGDIVYSTEDFKRARSFTHGVEWASRQVAQFAVELGVLSPEDVKHV